MEIFTRTAAVAALGFVGGSNGRDPMQFALQSGRIGRGTQRASQGIAELKINSAHRKARVSCVCDVREEGRGRSKLRFYCTRKKRIITVIACKRRFEWSGWPYGVSFR